MRTPLPGCPHRGKNQIPGFPRQVTYVRTFSSGNRETAGIGGVAARQSASTTKGEMVIQDCLERLQFERRWDVRFELSSRNRPVGEEKVEPRLAE
jgi:hypothetical protein